MGYKTKVVGVTFDGRQKIIKEINPMVDKLIAIREPNNPYDKNAIGIYVLKLNGDKHSVGYIESSKTGLAAKLTAQIDKDKDLIINDYFITGAFSPNIAMGILIDYSLVDKLVKII
jgi:hypothetical protein